MVFEHSSIFSDSVPDFHLICSLQNTLRGKSFADVDVLKNYLDYFASKVAQFYMDRILTLPERRLKFVEK